jgi:two-component system, OmpR family, response regulator
MRILVADDEQILVDFLARSLRLDKNVVDTASEGKDAYCKASKNTYDVVVAGLTMPGKAGLDVCSELRESGIHTPILVLSSSDSEYARIQSLDCGADDYLAKPFGYTEFVARLRALSRRPHQFRPRTVAAGDLALNQLTKTIVLRGSPLELRPREYALLEYLMLRPGKVISKEELLRNVWLISTQNASNRLEVCMHHIRSKLNSHTEKQILKTVRGYGYVISHAEA